MTPAVGFCVVPQCNLSMFDWHSPTTHLGGCAAQNAPLFWSSQELCAWCWTKEYNPPHRVLGLRTSLQGHFARLLGEHFNVHFVRSTHFVFCALLCFLFRFPVCWCVQLNMLPMDSTSLAFRCILPESSQLKELHISPS